jgi:hypothetical protein
MTVTRTLIEVVPLRRLGSNHELHSLREFVMLDQDRTTSLSSRGIEHASSAPPVDIPPGHVGEFVIPGTGRRVWWTGRVAIGLRHQPVRSMETTTQSSMWIQNLMLGGRRAAHAL